MVDAPDILNWITQPSETGFSDLGVIEVRCFVQRGNSGVFTPLGGFLPNSQLDQIKADLWSWYDSLGWSLTKYENEGNINDWWKVTLQEGVSQQITLDLNGEHSVFGARQLAILSIRQASDNSSGIIEGLELSYQPPSRKGGPSPSGRLKKTYSPKSKTPPAGSMAFLRK